MTDLLEAIDVSSARLEEGHLHTIKSLIRQSMFWRPGYLAQSAWLEHVPFAFWLVEAHRPQVLVELGSHYGVSYFSFCQAIERLNLDSRCFAVDTWKGDEHAGFYPEAVFSSVNRHNDEQYSGFSRLVRSTFDDAAQHFAPDSIDLLHIDGLHTLESVSHDFNTWLPKLSANAIVLLHDTNVRERGFGVSQFLESIRDEYPSFEFIHGHGLGVVCVGKDAPASLEILLDSNHDPVLRHAIRDLFGRLGRGVADSFLLREGTKRIDRLQADTNSINAQVKTLKSERSEVDASLQKAKADVARLEKAVEDYTRTLDSRFFELTTLTTSLDVARETKVLAELRAAQAEKKYNELIHYARQLERKHMSVLQSTSWRALEPAREMARRLRRKSALTPFKPRL